MSLYRNCSSKVSVKLCPLVGKLSGLWLLFLLLVSTDAVCYELVLAPFSRHVSINCFADDKSSISLPDTATANIGLFLQYMGLDVYT